MPPATYLEPASTIFNDSLKSILPQSIPHSGILDSIVQTYWHTSNTAISNTDSGIFWHKLKFKREKISNERLK
jgi:hypothetical protein